jgi:thiol-disulfide isomerase/thioredoxin
LTFSRHSGGKIMKKIIFKTLNIFTLALFVVSMTGAAAASTKCNANPDTFDLSPSKCFVGNVLSNDQGSELKVVSTSKTINGGKAIVYSKGDFYYKPAFCSKTTVQDSFTYTIEDKYGQKSTAKVRISYSKTQESTGTGAVVELTQLEQINKALQEGPVLLKIGAEWCEYCQQLTPTINELETEYDGKATIVSIDVDKSPKLADYFGVRSIPDSCVIVGTDNGEYVYRQEDGSVTTDRSQARILGSQDKEVFEKLLNFAASES